MSLTKTSSEKNRFILTIISIVVTAVLTSVSVAYTLGSSSATIKSNVNNNVRKIAHLEEMHEGDCNPSVMRSNIKSSLEVIKKLQDKLDIYIKEESKLNQERYDLLIEMKLDIIVIKEKLIKTDMIFVPK